MSTMEMKERLIGRIREIENEDILAEAYRLLGIQGDIEVPYELSMEQKSTIEEAQNQIRNGHYLTNEEADNEIDEWLKK